MIMVYQPNSLDCQTIKSWHVSLSVPEKSIIASDSPNLASSSEVYIYGAVKLCSVVMVLLICALLLWCRKFGAVNLPCILLYTNGKVNNIKYKRCLLDFFLPSHCLVFCRISGEEFLLDWITFLTPERLGNISIMMCYKLPKGLYVIVELDWRLDIDLNFFIYLFMC